MVASLLFCAQAFVDGFYELVRRPEAAGLAIYAIVVERRLRGLHLFEREAFLNTVGDAVANDGGHVAVFDEVGLIGHAAVPRNNIGCLLYTSDAADDLLCVD